MPEAAADQGPLPTFVIAGAMRAGSTALSRWLSAHPEVFMAPRKELHFFDKADAGSISTYRAEFADWSGQPAIGEATPNYLFASGAVERLVATIPDVRVVVSLRDPVERAYSHYWSRRSRALEVRSFAELVGEEQARPADASADPNGLDLLARGRYLDQIHEALRHLPRPQLLVVLFDDVEGSPTETFAQICTFVDVDPTQVPAEVGRPANAYRRFRSQRVRRLARRLPAPAADVVGHLNSRAEGYPPLDPGLRDELRAWYRPANQELAEWLGRDLSAWGC